MSLYNLVHGTNPLAGMVLAMIGVAVADVPRFRDAYYDGTHLCIHTRTGGGNRDDYAAGNDYLASIPGYVRDDDDDFDSTYATFYYLVPEQFAWFKDWASNKTQRPAGERWQEAIDCLKNAPPDDPLVKRMTEVMAPIVEFLKKQG
jgi:hypothetical protein